MCKSILIHSSVSLLLVLVLMLVLEAYLEIARISFSWSISRTEWHSLSNFDYEHEQEQETCTTKRLRALLCHLPFTIPFLNARVVEWQTRTFEGRMPKGMRVQVPPRALFRYDLGAFEIGVAGCALPYVC